MQVIEEYNLCTNAEDYNLWKLEYQCSFKHGSHPAHCLTSHIISHTNNMIIKVSKMRRISLHISGVDLQYTQWSLHLSNYTGSKAKRKLFHFQSQRNWKCQICYYPNALKILPCHALTLCSL